jgi:uncharacterized membrane protein
VFVFLAGVGAYLQTARGKTTAEVSRFLLTRGLWLVVLEVTVVRTGAFFNFDYSFLGILQVIWVIGLSMVLLAGLVHLPLKVVGACGIAMIAIHNGFDGVRVQGWAGPGSTVPDVWAKAWIVLHQAGEFLPVWGASGPVVFLMYPLIPWVGVMAAGYAFGIVYTFTPERRLRVLRACGISMILCFVALRAIDVYGDPQHWAVQATTVFTMLSFVNTTKYPPSLLFLLMTLGPALLALAWLETTRRGAIGRRFITFGRVPLFFYLLQWPLAHAIAITVSYLAGKEIGYYFLNPPALFTTAPPGAGFDLPVVYACWILAILLLYPLCRWFADVKRRRRDWWLSYL